MSSPDATPARRRADRAWYKRLITLERAWLVVISLLVLNTANVAKDAANDAKDAGNNAKVASVQAKHAAKKANDNVKEIQRSRIDATRSNCLDQNRKHDRTIKRLHTLIGRITDPAQKVQAEAQVASTIYFIEAFVPHRDCAKVVQKITAGVTTQP